ncbi:MAG: efflux RND transporter periplasmic adaptor subunit [Steroidobacteraceae bacterium]
MPKLPPSPESEGIVLAGRWTCLALVGVLALLTACADNDAPAQASELMKGRENDAARAKPDSRSTAIVVSEATHKDFGNVVEAIGTARANEALDVTAKVSNRVSAIRFHEGEEVKAGAVLVEFDSEEARANLAEADAALKDSRSQFKRSRELYQTRALSEAQLDQLQATLSANEARVAAARSLLNDLTIRAPFAGRVGLRNISVGSFVSPGTVITTLDDTRIIKLDFSVPEIFLPVLKEGQQIDALSAAYPAQPFKGTVASIDSRVDPVSRSIVVRARIDNTDRRLKPGMLMTVRLMRAEPPALVVPEEALVPQGERQFVFVVRDGKAERIEVQIGRRRPGEVEIVKGLAPGEQVVTEGTQKVRDGTPVHVVARGGLPA